MEEGQFCVISAVTSKESMFQEWSVQKALEPS
jgi:hypothetical protein